MDHGIYQSHNGNMPLSFASSQYSHHDGIGFLGVKAEPMQPQLPVFSGQSSLGGVDAERIIASATHETLTRAQNTAYMQLYNHAQSLQASVATQKELLDHYRALLSQPGTSSVSSAGATPFSTRTSTPMPGSSLITSDRSRGILADTSHGIPIIALPPGFNQAEFPNVPYWHKSSWDSKQNRISNVPPQDAASTSNGKASRTNKKLLYLTESDGQVISPEVHDQVTKVFYGCLQDLVPVLGTYFPHTWGVAGTRFKNYCIVKQAVLEKTEKAGSSNTQSPSTPPATKKAKPATGKAVAPPPPPPPPATSTNMAEPTMDVPKTHDDRSMTPLSELSEPEESQLSNTSGPGIENPNGIQGGPQQHRKKGGPGALGRVKLAIDPSIVVPPPDLSPPPPPADESTKKKKKAKATKVPAGTDPLDAATAAKVPKKKRATQGIKPTNSTAAKNLYLIDYLKENDPISGKDYAELWKSIDRNTKLTYEKKSLAAKPSKATKKAQKGSKKGKDRDDPKTALGCGTQQQTAELTQEDDEEDDEEEEGEEEGA
ncbi:hypothetical protein EST38_g1548 [Candolleomyces aberdarensis]|uniref:Uncharacterized protein n=1 Tax=Candolleomyces aberdarensis TaxID=2316362 RepID=A0A4Q2DZ43_9AGAR|nr:hypothetical protein EST38_g1548 [Candolleomyces aberdarensis]